MGHYVWRHAANQKLKALLVDQPTVSQQEAEQLRATMLQAFDRAWCARVLKILQPGTPGGCNFYRK